MNTLYDFKASLDNWIAHVSLGVAIILLVTVGTGTRTVAAQEPHRWSPDEQVPGYLDDTFTPYLLADQNRTVHAFANQWVGDEETRQSAIVYRQWSLDGGWTAPVDILLSPVGGAQILGAFLDQTGTMHVAFQGGEAWAANLYYSRAPATIAGQARAWSKPELVGEALSSPPSGALAGDDKGNLVIIYSGKIDGNGIYAIQSSDAGDSWSEPEPIFLTYEPELTPFSVHATMDQAGQLHAVWNVVTSLGVDESAHYARLDVAGQQWSPSVLLDERIDEEGFFGPSFPVMVNTGDKLVVMYNSGNPDAGGPVDAGRPVQRVRLSKDEGRTWRDAVSPFPNHLGRSGEHSLVVDSNNVVHALFMQRIETSTGSEITVIDGPWHSALLGDRWSEPNNYPTRWSPHDVRAVIVQGNVLLVTWQQDPGEGESGVWYTYTILDAPELPVVPLPIPTATPPAAPTPTATPPSPTPTPMQQSAPISQEPMPAQPAGGPAVPLILGLVPVVLLVVGVIMVQQWLQYRHH